MTDLPQPTPLSADHLRRLCHEAGADDVGFVALDDPALDGERPHVLAAMGSARALISVICRMNPPAIRSANRSLANDEFHHAGARMAEVTRRIVTALTGRGVAALAVPAGFPMDMSAYPGRMWAVSHKLVAEAAGTGLMGLHRIVIHPRFGNNILLGTVVLDRLVDAPGRRLEVNPCLDCHLCVAACPVGAIKPDGRFDFSACHTHNYLEFNGGFLTLLDTLADAKSARDLRARLSDAEQVSWWQSLAFGPNYKAAYCMAVCPAGSDILPRYAADKARWKHAVLRPLTAKAEDVYVVPGTDAEDHLRRRFPHKRVRLVRAPLRPTSIAGMLRALPLAFNPGKAAGLDATYQFRFVGAEPAEAAVTIRDGRLQVTPGLAAWADLTVTADSRAWLRYLRGEAGLVGAVLTGKVRVRGPLALMRRFKQCFPR